MPLYEKTLDFKSDDGIDIIMHTDGLVEITALGGKDGRLLQISKENFEKMINERAKLIISGGIP